MTYKKRKRGQSLVEFAILTPFIILVLASILELAPLLNAYVKVEKATHAAAREASIFGASDSQILDKLAVSMYGMTFPQYYTTFDTDSHEVGFNAYNIDDGNPCSLASPHEIFRSTDEDEDYPDQHCYSEAIESYGIDPTRTIVQITPTRKSRINGSWVTVSTRYRYRVYTPVLFFFADLLFAEGTSTVKVVPFYKFSTQRVE